MAPLISHWSQSTYTTDTPTAVQERYGNWLAGSEPRSCCKTRPSIQNKEKLSDRFSKEVA